MNPGIDRLLTLEEAAAVLGTKPRFARRLVAERRIRFTRVGRFVRIPESALRGALDNLGTTLQKVGRSEKAITTDQNAAAIFRETGDRHDEAMALSYLEADQTAHSKRTRPHSRSEVRSHEVRSRCLALCLTLAEPLPGV